MNLAAESAASPTKGGRHIVADCFACKGCGQADASGFPCQSCGGKGYRVYKKPARDYEAAGARAFRAGMPINANPYRYGWPSHGWILGWLDAQDDKRKATFAITKELEQPK